MPGQQVFLGVGHGRTPNGRFDRGASFDGREEYEMNWRVVHELGLALDRCGVTYYTEEAAGMGHDPNFAGSAKKANELGAPLAVEVHHNASTTHEGHGCEMLVHPRTNEATRRLARATASLLNRRLDLHVRHGDGVWDPETSLGSGKSKFGFLNNTDMPAVIPEISFVDNAIDREIASRDDYYEQAAEALAEAICSYLGQPYVERE